MSLWGQLSEPFRSGKFWSAVKSILGSGSVSQAWTDYVGKQPDLPINDANTVFAAGLSAVQAGRDSLEPGADLDTIGELAPGVWEVPTGTFRYRITVRVYDPLTGGYVYRIFNEDTSDLLTDAQIKDIAEARYRELDTPNRPYEPHPVVEVEEVVLTQSVP